MAVSIPLQFLADFQKSGKEIEKFSKQSAKSIGKIESGLGNLAKGALAAGAAYFTARGLISGIKAVTQAAATQEAAVNDLNTALATAGDFSQEASDDLQAFASELQNTTTVGDETTLKMLALAKTFGVTNDGAKDLVRAATELSAATGKSLESSVTNLGKTFAGLTGELGESLPALRGLSAESLKAGGAVQLVLDRFSGSAAGKLNTFEGATTALGNAFGDLQENIGKAITNSPEVIKFVNVLRGLFIELGAAVGEGDGGIFGGLVNSIVSLTTRLIPAFLRGLRPLGAAIQTIGELAAQAGIGVIEAYRGFFNAFDVFIVSIQLGLEALLNKLASFLSVVGANGLASKLRRLGQSVRESINENLDQLDVRDETVDRLGVKIAGASVGFTDALDKAISKSDQISRAVEEQVRKGVQRGGGIVNLPGGGGGGNESLGPGEIKDKSGFFKEREDNQKKLAEEAAATQSAIQGGLQSLGTVLQNIQKGADGAADAVIEVSKVVADQLLPGLGAVIGPLLNFAKDPEAFRGFFESFIEALPEVIKVLGQGLGDVIQILADNADEIILAVIENIPEVIESLIRATPKIAAALLRSLPAIVKGFGGLISELFKLVVKLFEEGAGELGVAFEQAITQPIAQLGTSLNNIAINFVTVFREKLDFFFEFVGQFFADLGTKILNIPLKLAEGVLTAFETLGTTLASGLNNALSNAFNFDGFGDKFVNAIKEPFTKLIDSFDPTKGVKSAGSKVQSGFQKAGDFIGLDGSPGFGLAGPANGGDIINGTSQGDVLLAAILRELKLIRESGGRVSFADQRRADELLSLNRQNQRTSAA